MANKQRKPQTLLQLSCNRVTTMTLSQLGDEWSRTWTNEGPTELMSKILGKYNQKIKKVLKYLQEELPKTIENMGKLKENLRHMATEMEIASKDTTLMKCQPGLARCYAQAQSFTRIYSEFDKNTLRSSSI